MVHSSICADLSVTEVSVTHSVAGKDFVREVKVEVAATERITRTVKPLSQAQQARRKPQQATKTRPETVVFRDIESDDVRTDEKPVPVDEDRDQERKLAKPEVQEKVVDAVVVVGESVVKRKDVKEVVVVEKTAVAIKAKTAKRKVFNDENKENMMPPRPQSANQPPEDEPKRRRTRGNGRRGRIPRMPSTAASDDFVDFLSTKCRSTLFDIVCVKCTILSYSGPRAERLPPKRCLEKLTF
ncbi:hypothetical protein HK101_010397 [Irineochytrium annulatum]|nr:hypothetical protein HK101_010397 [Irineochytrium annulatum]